MSIKKERGRYQRLIEWLMKGGYSFEAEFRELPPEKGYKCFEPTGRLIVHAGREEVR